jgi:hypothetical protein
MYLLYRFLKLSPSDRTLFLQAFLCLNFIRLGLWLFPFQTIQQLLIKINQVSSKPKSRNLIDLSKIGRAIHSISHYLPGQVRCLAQALTAHFLICHYGYSPQLKIGFAKGEGGLIEAHAWVECQGQVVMGDSYDLPRFTTLPALSINHHNK